MGPRWLGGTMCIRIRFITGAGIANIIDKQCHHLADLHSSPMRHQQHGPVPCCVSIASNSVSALRISFGVNVFA